MLPENDRWSETRSQLLAQMDVSMGGRVAEEIIFGHEYVTTGKKEFLNKPVSQKCFYRRLKECKKILIVLPEEKLEFYKGNIHICCFFFFFQVHQATLIVPQRLLR